MTSTSNNFNNSKDLPAVKKLPTWEILAALVGYTVSVGPTIELIGYHFLDYKKENIPYSIRLWVGVGYLFLTLVIGSVTLLKLSKGKQPKDMPSSDELLKAWKKIKWIRALKTFGFSFLHEWLLNLCGVIFYGGFSRYGDWENRPELFSHIDRFMLENGTVEYQYSRDYRYVEQRFAPAQNGKFRDAESKKWLELEHGKFTFFSLTGFWWTLCHFVTFRFRKNRSA